MSDDSDSDSDVGIQRVLIQGSDVNDINVGEIIFGRNRLDSETSSEDADYRHSREFIDFLYELPTPEQNSNNESPRVVQARFLGVINGSGRIVRGDPDRVIVPPILQPVTHYDQNLTPAHKYLGDGLHETTGRTIFEEGVVHIIPVIFLKINLIPGQILPIIARSLNVKTILKYALARNRVFGVSYKFNTDKRTFGTIAEVYEHSVDIESSQSFQIKAMGHQRYEILSKEEFPGSNEDSIALARIKIIPDITLSFSHNKLCLHPRKRKSTHSEMCRKRDMWQTQWPGWVYKQFDVHHLASQLAAKVKMLYKDVKISDDPNLLSLQVTKLGVFNQDQVSYLLGIESTNLRLQYELHYWNKHQSMQTFMCARDGCGVPICNMNSVFPMSPEGPQGTYCNSQGYIHDLITVTELDDDTNVIAIGSPSTECSWFPGYKWMIILCSSCQSHLGWRYLADENSAIIPRLFYGLAMRSITSTKDYLQSDSTRRSRFVDINEDILITI